MMRGEVGQLWQRALFAMLVSSGVLFFGRGRPSAGGVHLYVSTTVVPSDAQDLDCDSIVVLNGNGCAFSGGRRVRESEAKGVLRPFVTVQGEVVLLAGLFEAPAVSKWLTAARDRGASERVLLACRCSYEGSIDNVGVRWRSIDEFEVHRSVRTARVEACTIEKLP